MYEEVPESAPWHSQDERHQVPLAALGLGTWVWQRDRECLTLSGRSLAILGLTEADQALAKWTDRVHARDRHRLEGELATIFAGLSSTFECTYRVQIPGGTTRWIRTKGTTMRSEDGTVITVHGIHEDVSPRLEMEQALRQAEARFRTLVEGCPDAVVVLREGRLTYGNPRLAALLGTDAYEGTPLLEWILPEDRREVAEGLRAAIKAESNATLTVRLERADRVQLEVELAALGLDYEGLPALCVLLRDVTEKKELQLRLDRSNRMASLGTLAAGVAHEINNPLTFITANLQGLEEDLPELVDHVRRLMGLIVKDVGAQRANQWFRQAGLDDLDGGVARLINRTRDAVEGATRVRDIVQDLDTYARVDGGAPGPVDLSRAVEIALNMCRHQLKHGVAVDVDIQDVPTVYGEEGRLSQVFLNLVVNAAQAGAELIQIRARPDADAVRIQVIDDGPGMSADVVERVFEPFYTTKEPGRGTGLGLSISREILVGYGGEVEVRSEQGRGTTFELILPFALDDVTDALEETPIPVPDVKPERRRILLVDDERPLVEAYALLLEKHYEVVTAVNGEEALARMNEPGVFDAVICDLVMPGLSGMGLHAWLEVHRPELVDRLIWMTGGAVGDDARTFLDHTTNLVLKKPVDIHHLRGLLQGLLARPL